MYLKCKKGIKTTLFLRQIKDNYVSLQGNMQIKYRRL